MIDKYMVNVSMVGNSNAIDFNNDNVLKRLFIHQNFKEILVRISPHFDVMLELEGFWILWLQHFLRYASIQSIRNS